MMSLLFVDVAIVAVSCALCIMCCWLVAVSAVVGGCHVFFVVCYVRLLLFAVN